MSIGYASLTVHVRNTTYKTCRMNSCTDDKLRDIITHNLTSLEHTIEYNIKNDIHLYRISSDLIPFGSSPVNQINWLCEFSEEFKRIAEKIRAGKVRISMHPGQYTLLNTPNQDILNRSIEDLWYHTRLLEALGGNQTNKIILHVGGIYQDKEEAMKRFIKVYHSLPQAIKNHLVIENDERSYTIFDCLKLHEATGVPVVYDNLHHALNHDEVKTDAFWIEACRKTWKVTDGVQKVHYSQQHQTKQPGAHTDTIDIKTFEAYYLSLQEIPDIMLEVKDKNLSAIKCINCFERLPQIKHLEQEWSMYKYQVLATSPRGYQEIRNLLKEKSTYPCIEFYQLLDEALATPPTVKGNVNTLQHIWGYFKQIATSNEKETFKRLLQQYINGTISITRPKTFLIKLTNQYENAYLQQSTFF